jgi:hypothetical protein
MMGLALTTGSPGVRPWLSKVAAPRLKKTPWPAATRRFLRGANRVLRVRGVRPA